MRLSVSRGGALLLGVTAFLCLSLACGNRPGLQSGNQRTAQNLDDNDAVVVHGNATCGRGLATFRIEEGARDARFTDGALRVSLSRFTGPTFDYSASVAVKRVIVRGGPLSKLYTGGKAGSVTTAVNPDTGKRYGFQHVTFCYQPQRQGGVISARKSNGPDEHEDEDEVDDVEENENEDIAEVEDEDLNEAEDEEVDAPENEDENEVEDVEPAENENEEEDEEDVEHPEEDDVPPPENDDERKVGICHHTGSATNPIVFIEVSVNAIPAHLAHGDTIGVASIDECPVDGNTSSSSSSGGMQSSSYPPPSSSVEYPVSSSSSKEEHSQVKVPCPDGTVTYRLYAPGAGLYTDGVLEVMLSDYTSNTFKWSTNIGVDAVMVKSGLEENVYYPDEGMSGQCSSVNMATGEDNPISYIRFCYDVDNAPE